MSAKMIIRGLEIALILGSLGIGASMANSILGSGTANVAATQLSSKFLDEHRVSLAKGIKLDQAKATVLEKRQVITPAGAAR